MLKGRGYTIRAQFYKFYWEIVNSRTFSWVNKVVINKFFNFYWSGTVGYVKKESLISSQIILVGHFLLVSSLILLIYNLIKIRIEFVGYICVEFVITVLPSWKFVFSCFNIVVKNFMESMKDITFNSGLSEISVLW